MRFNTRYRYKSKATFNKLARIYNCFDNKTNNKLNLKILYNCFNNKTNARQRHLKLNKKGQCNLYLRTKDVYLTTLFW